ncbi:hypothetical protein AK812_SmicGene30703 [Symbiodinium microadriaticum]|uniref:Retrovirus-related Pol polyprotein from transposon TNT 1-94 n=1 Tax=Symbiodinium microadriaticum TaxID=2951 RepID=A0A1Q9CYL2_SYMMI|nr:hypothetical protein AK812_SmicGene30703 [Symbiodinium microadriaticum]
MLEGKSEKQDGGKVQWKVLWDIDWGGNKTPWELGMAYSTWRRQVCTVAGTVGSRFQLYVEKCFVDAERRYQQKSRDETQNPLTGYDAFPNDYEGRFVAQLLKVLPDRVKSPAMEMSAATTTLHPALVIEELVGQIKPGGCEEQTSLTRFVRSLEPVATATEGIHVLRRWRLARSRIQALGLPEAAPFELWRGLQVLVSRLEKKHESLKTRMSICRLQSSVQLGQPKGVGVDIILEQIDKELCMLAADEATKANAAGHHDDPTAHKGLGKGKEKGKGKSSSDLSQTVCPFLSKPGGCTFGDRCHYKHPDATSPRLAPNPKGKATPDPAKQRKCMFHNRKGGCKLGNKCKFLHEGPGFAEAAAAQEDNSLVGSGGADLAEAKARDLLDGGQDAITCESVYQLIKQSQLPPQTKHRAVIEGDDATVTAWTFGFWSHGGAHVSGAEAGSDIAMGDRVTLGAYTPEGIRRAAVTDLMMLGELGFPTPQLSSTVCARSEATEAAVFNGAHQTTPERQAQPPQSPNASTGDVGFGHQDYWDDVCEAQAGRDVGQDLGLLEFGVDFGESSGTSHDRPVTAEAVVISDDDQSIDLSEVPDLSAELPEKNDDDEIRKRTFHQLAAQGLRHPHRKVRPEDIALGSLAIDIAGPYKEGCFRYALIGVFTFQHAGPGLSFVKLLRNRKLDTILTATEQILGHLTYLGGDRSPVVRLHSDNALEFVAERFSTEINNKGIFKTVTVPHNPASNGRAERQVQALKRAALQLLLEGHLERRFWPQCLLEAAAYQRDAVLNVLASKKQLVPGDCCAIRVHQPGPFEAKAEKAIFLARDEKTSKGVWVLVTRNGIQQLTRARQPIKLAASEEKWRLHKLEDRCIWVSSQGRSKEASSEVIDELPTLEERLNDVGKYHVLSSALEEAITKDMSVFRTGPRKDKWIESLKKEYAKMAIPSKIVPTLKPVLDQLACPDGDGAAACSRDAFDNGWKEKSRIVACGNYEAATSDEGQPWTSSNVPAEIIRLFVAMAARQRSWGIGAFDVEAAFLNAPLSTEEAVLITPPKLMIELGIIPEDTTWVARRAIYGLKRSPTEWQTARDAALDNMHIDHIAAGPSDTLGTLVLHPLDLSAGLWAIKSVDTEALQGLLCTYVDDDLL